MIFLKKLFSIVLEDEKSKTKVKECLSSGSQSLLPR